MATSSIKKNFVVNSKKSALELADKLLEVESSLVPTMNRPRISRLIVAEQLPSFLANANKGSSRR